MCQPMTSRGLSEREIDAELVATASQGGADGQKAFARIVKRHEGRVRRITYSVLRSAEDAQDAAQEVFVRVWRRLSDFDSNAASFSTWIYRIATNIAIDCYRRRASKACDVSLDALGSDATILAAVPSDQTDCDGETTCRVETARSAVMSLSEKHREVLLLREAEGLTYAEIAARTGLKRGTVMSRLFYARKYAASQCAATP